MARRARSPEERDMLLNMARTWDDLASYRTEQIARQTRLTAGPAGDHRTNGAPIPIDPSAGSDDG
jgi:hypothetical protein